MLYKSIKMPKSKINDYIFYKITCLDDSVDLCYVGSTANWKERQRSHKNSCTNANNKRYNTKVYKTIRENGNWDNFKMIELGQAQHLTKRQAEQIEEYYREDLKANMNDKRCYTTQEQKREQKKQYNKEYRTNNIVKLKEYELNYRTNNKHKIKEYQQANADKILVQHKEYRDNNKDKFEEIVTCECGCEVRRDHLTRHKKTKKHINLMSV